MNKLMTGVAIAQLVQSGKLSYDDTVAKFLDFPNAADAKKIQVKHLLTHTSGLGSYAAERFETEQPETVTRMLEIARENATLAFAPGTRQRYSNTGFVVLGAIIEKVTGQAYHDYMRANVYKPAGMTHTMTRAEAAKAGNLAFGYGDGREARARSAGSPTDGNPAAKREAVPPSGPAGGGYSTVDDLLRFAEAIRRHRLLSPEATRTMLAPQRDLNAPTDGLGVGRWRDQPLIVGYNGGAPGVYTNLDIFLESGYTAVVLTNEGDGSVWHQGLVDRIRGLVAAIERGK